MSIIRETHNIVHVCVTELAVASFTKHGLLQLFLMTTEHCTSPVSQGAFGGI